MTSLREKYSQETEEQYRICLYRPPLMVNFNPKAWLKSNIADVTAGYAYVLNLPSIGEAKPGFLFHAPYMDGTKGSFSSLLPNNAEELEKRLEADDLYYHSPDQMPYQGYTIAFLRNPHNGEILYLRRDSNNLWSFREITEKGGCRKPHMPRQFDNDGAVIKCPAKANLAPFTEVLGYASIPHKGILYKRRIVLPDDVMRPFFRAVPAEVKLTHLRH
jgi:hypothetical protein